LNNQGQEKARVIVCAQERGRPKTKPTKETFWGINEWSGRGEKEQSLEVIPKGGDIE